MSLAILSKSRALDDYMSPFVRKGAMSVEEIIGTLQNIFGSPPN
jgi:hypothetical protein